MSQIFRLVLLALAFLMLAVGAKFAADNSQMLTIAWGSWDSVAMPVFAWLVLCALCGFFLAYFLLGLVNVRQRGRIRRLESQLRNRPADSTSLTGGNSAP